VGRGLDWKTEASDATRRDRQDFFNAYAAQTGARGPGAARLEAYGPPRLD